MTQCDKMHGNIAWERVIKLLKSNDYRILDLNYNVMS